MITNYGTLKSQVQLYLYNRKDLTAQIPEFISLAEKKVFRQLRCRFNEVLISDTLTDNTGFALPENFVEMKFLTVNEKPLTCGNTLLRASGRSVDAQWIRYAERIALTSLVPHVTGIKVSIHRSAKPNTVEVLQAIRTISDQEPSIAVGQIVID